MFIFNNIICFYFADFKSQRDRPPARLIMKFEVQSSLSLVFLSIVNMCLCVQDFAEKTLNTLSTELSHAKRHHQQSMNHHLHSHSPHRFFDNAENFLLIDYLADGEMERRISYNGVTAKETTIGNSR